LVPWQGLDRIHLGEEWPDRLSGTRPVSLGAGVQGHPFIEEK